jgi:phosphoribosylpyrophosphate synthetase
MPVGEGLIRGRWFTWILDNHWDFGGAKRTDIGQLVFDAKYANDDAATLELMAIARHSILQISRFAGEDGPSGVECVVAVPSSSRPDDDATLPRILSSVVSQALGVPDASIKVSIVPGLAPAKLGAVRRSKDFSVSADFTFKNVLLVDDLLSTGKTMVALGECLASRRNSSRLSGFALSKVHIGLGN